MDWVIDTNNGGALRALRSEVVAYVERHAESNEGLDDVRLVISELIANCARHASGPLWLTIDWSAVEPVVSVADLGPGFDPVMELPEASSMGGRGLYLINQVSQNLAVRRRTAGGSVVSTTLPIRREMGVSIDPPRRRTSALPGLDEAGPDGGFGKEAFLRALVVQLAQSIAEQGGPDAAERAVAQVGVDVGGQMEAEFRAARSITGRMSTAQLAECYVRLKHAIDGQFSVTEIDDRRIVLENTRCPFGLAVRQAPALCRMTSSVFGGIAARNTDGGARIVLAERIAVGDPTCRVIVELDPDPSAESLGHRYLSPS